MDDRRFWDSVWYIAESPASCETPGVARAEEIDALIQHARDMMKWRAAALRQSPAIEQAQS
jgi:hypothetical protein